MPPAVARRPTPVRTARPAAPTPRGSATRATIRTRAWSRDPRVGTTVAERYYLRRLCGEGAMGRVYEGQHIDIGRRVAVKILQSSYRHSAELVERFRREARAASRIGHPNIVDVTDSGTTDDGAFFFVMEYLDGINLEDLINREGMLAVDRALLIGAQICRALQAAHSADVIHRDLKPANIMLINRKEDEDFVKVLDFGISKTISTPAGQAPGPDQPRRRRRHAGLHVARAGGGHAGRRAHRRLRGGRPALRDADRGPAVRRRQHPGDPQQEGVRGSAPVRELRPDIPPDVEAGDARARALRRRSPAVDGDAQGRGPRLPLHVRGRAGADPRRRAPARSRRASLSFGAADPASCRRDPRRAQKHRARRLLLGGVAAVAVALLVVRQTRQDTRWRRPTRGGVGVAVAAPVTTTTPPAPAPAPPPPRALRARAAEQLAVEPQKLPAATARQGGRAAPREASPRVDAAGDAGGAR